MYNRIGDSSNLLTASSQSEHGIRQNPFIYYRNYKRMKFINFSIQGKLKKMNLYRVRASVYPTPHNKIWLSSGRVPLYSILISAEYINLSA